MPRTRSGAFTQPQERGREFSLQPTPIDQKEPGITSLAEDLCDEVESQTEALINPLTNQLRRALSEHFRQSAELRAENAQCRTENVRCKEEAERLRQELEKGKETLSKERDTWNKERDRWQTTARQLRMELNEKDENIGNLQRGIEDLHTRVKDNAAKRKAGLEAIVEDTRRFLQSSKAAKELFARQEDRVFLIQLGQIVREETEPRSIADIIEELLRHDDATPT